MARPKIKLGRISYINCFPVYGAIDRGLVNCPADLVTGSPAELSDLLAAGELDVSVISAVEYSKNASLYHLLPDLAISCDGPVRSVVLYSKTPVGALDDATILVSQSSRTSAYTRTLEEVWAEAEVAREVPVREFHIVGGLHPKLKLAYYTELIKGLKERHPHVHIKALTAVEIAHLARIERVTSVDVLEALIEAGLDTIPGGGAEVFGPAIRASIAGRKLAADEWIRIHREAHQLGVRSNCTMLYGHVETVEDRVQHLERLRDLQDETGGFLTYIPLAYHPDHNELGRELGREGTATTGFDDLKNIAVGRLFLDNIDHVKTHWPMVTPLLSQVALNFGCDDLEGTVVYERIYHEAGAQTPM